MSKAIAVLGLMTLLVCNHSYSHADDVDHAQAAQAPSNWQLLDRHRESAKGEREVRDLTEKFPSLSLNEPVGPPVAARITFSRYQYTGPSRCPASDPRLIRTSLETEVCTGGPDHVCAGQSEGWPGDEDPCDP